MTITLRYWRESDAVRLQALSNNPAVARNLRDGFPSPYTLDDAKEFLAQMAAAQPGQTWARAVCVDGELAGSVGGFRLKDVGRCGAEVGYFLGEQYWGKGIMAVAVREICALIFAESDIARLEAGVYEWNRASCRVLEKAGFSLESVMRRKFIKNGVIGDIYMYAKFRDNAG